MNAEVHTLHDDMALPELPRNIEAEQAALGAMLVNNEVAKRCVGLLRAEHFYQPVHGRIWAALVETIERGSTATPMLLAPAFEHDEGLADVGGAQYLARLAGSAVTIINAEDYARQVVDLWQRREIAQICQDAEARALDFQVNDPAADQLGGLIEALGALAAEQPDDQAVPIADAVGEAIAEIEAAYRGGEPPGLRTGLAELDKLVVGLEAGDLVIVAGRPSMGKTALATTIAANVAKTGGKVGFFSLEMGKAQIAKRLLSHESGVSLVRLRRGEVWDGEFERMAEAEGAIGRLPIVIDPSQAATVGAIRARARKMASRGGLDLVIVDYLQLMESDGRRGENRTQEITKITRDLKRAATELGVPFLVLSQLSRNVENREDKRPHLSDLRESGSIEQDADTVIFVYRQEYYLSQEAPPDHEHEKMAKWLEKLGAAKGQALAIVAKQRHGQCGTAKMYWNAEQCWFGNLAVQGQMV